MILQYIAQDNPRAAEDLLASARETLELLSRHPGLGSLRRNTPQRLKGVRHFRVKAYPNYLIFYRPVPTGIQVMRLFHGMRDLESLLSEEIP
jgi:toxin ParE1/3/4